MAGAEISSIKNWYFEVIYLGRIVGEAQGYGQARVSKREKGFRPRAAHVATLKREALLRGRGECGHLAGSAKHRWRWAATCKRLGSSTKAGK
jgi:hypothetical protein